MALTMDPTKTPLMAPPDGMTSNFENPDTRHAEVHIGMGVTLSFTVVFIFLRIYAKLTVSRLWGWDDWTCLVGWLAIVVHDIITFTVLDQGIGKHMWDVPVSSQDKAYLQRIFSTGCLYTVSSFFVKMSLFFLYLRIFNPNKITRWLVYGGMVVCAVFYSACLIINCVIYLPGPGQADSYEIWVQRAVNGSKHGTSLVLAQSIFGFISDTYLLIVPVQLIFKLQLPLSRKIGVSAIFATGLIAVACSIVSIVYRVRAYREVMGSTYGDQTWYGAPVFILSSAEISTGIVCSCMPIAFSLTRHPTIRKLGTQLLSLTGIRSSRDDSEPPSKHSLNSGVFGRGPHRKFTATDSITQMYPGKVTLPSDGSSSRYYIELENEPHLRESSLDMMRDNP
ncbi:hypothetical protein M501DRAFT_1012451 [Patellaria atrata CBS 101060]|uniref:Rhodopsin domain-containing protein n=1 Tax=Patellaria atrata CBS 101060 TaxID=1346257 RepID=A0A9P4SI31_9PEZI|nr:hypothetical protein M501DRAFT_1012451 [Patellaria atrata CBS 101060]